MAESKRDSVQALEEIVGLSDKCREEGNKYFQAQLFDEARQWYTESIYICVEKVQEIRDNSSLYSWSMSTFEAGLHAIRKSLNLARSNRSEAFLRQEKYDFALADAENFLDFDANNAKALNRKGKSLAGLQLFERAHESFESALKLDPPNKDIQKSVKRTWICFRQSEGEFDLSDFYLHKGTGNNFLDPFCEYVGPLEIQLLPGRGRGLVLTRAVAAGKVLLASKALAVGSDGADLSGKLFNLYARCKKCRQKLRRLQAHKPYDSEDVPEPVSFISESNGREATESAKLTALNNPGASVARFRDEIDVPDIGIGVASLRAIPRKNAEDELLSTAPDGADRSSVSSNSEPCKTDVPTVDLFKACKFIDHRELIDNDADERELTDDDADEGEEPVDMLDMERITGIAAVNKFEVNSFCSLEAQLRAPEPDLNTEDKEGLWLLPSFLNHSCIPNCVPVIVGEDMILRATQDILAGEELTISYCDPFDPLYRRLISCLAGSRHFFCSCSRCCFEESIAELLEPIDMIHQKYMDRVGLDLETDSDFDECPPEVRFRLATGMTADDFVKKLDAVMSNIRDLDEIHRTWICASYMELYCGQAVGFAMNSKVRINLLKQLVEVAMTVQCSDINGLLHYSKLVREVGKCYGKRSKDFVEVERNFVEVFRVAFGVKERSAALKLIEKLDSIS